MLFSIIVPVYGVEKYISECLESILAQSFTDFELIAVDDGSKDGCPEILDSFAETDSRVRVIHKENGGLVSARKAGIEVANGDYIINVDGDDSVEPGYFEKAKALIAKYDPDIITFGLNYDYGDRKTPDLEMIPEGLYSESRLRTVTDSMLLTPDMRHMHYFLWAKAFRKSLIKEIQTGADNRISMGEDVMCVIPAYCRAKSVYVSSEIVYNCRCRTDSMSRSYKASHFDDIALGVSLLRKVENAPEGYTDAVSRYAAFMFFVIFATAASDGDGSVRRYAKKIMENGFEEAFASAVFDGITSKSKIAISLLKKKRFSAAYAFLRACNKLKGKQ